MQILGDRELLRHEVVRELAGAADAEAGPRFLHIVVRLADISSVFLNTATGHELSFDQGIAGGGRQQCSALTSALAHGDAPEAEPDRR